MAAPPKPRAGGGVHLAFRLMAASHVALYRLSGGRLGATLEGAPVLLLTVVGRKSGKRRTLPLLFLETDRSYALVASYAGSDRHPAWYLNLRANPEVEIQVGRRRSRARAATVSEERRQRLWPKLVELYPDYDLYQERTDRKIPVVELEPVE